ncbi:hypothetical protein TPHV1_210077 [Treponema phagedenis]|uniref:Uncharacterized protein n=1 Tax=Treponema phagedenis TaxID=162 RepID=A0A0B7GT76_TREPH|nr:hypothetical protein TPHV1_210077 [Treponema phagedenis]
MPTSFNASILQFCIDALKHRLEFNNGEQFTIGNTESAEHLLAGKVFTRMGVRCSLFGTTT